MYVSALYYYPVKSLKGVSVDQIEINDFGFSQDRRYMLIDAEGKFITQRQHHELSLYSASMMPNGIAMCGPNGFEIRLDAAHFRDRKLVQVWGDEVMARVMPIELLSKKLGFEVFVAYMPDESFRQVDRAFFDAEQRVNFADGFPVLLTNTASLEDLNSRLAEPVSMTRFRPNIVVTGESAFQEDDWGQIRIGEVIFDCVKPCSRCVMTTINEAGEKGKEPLKTLATYRRNEFGVCFGENLVQRNRGQIKVGDSLEVIN